MSQAAIRMQHFYVTFAGPINTDRDWSFYANWLETAHATINSLVGLSLDDPIPNSGFTLPIPVTVEASSSCAGGFRGHASPGQLVYCAGNWLVNWYCLGLLVQELTNLMTGACVTDGWPREWWADDRSPFPILMAVAVQNANGYSNEASAESANFSSEMTYQTHKTIVDAYGWSPYAKTFSLFRSGNINLGNYSEPLVSGLVMAALIRHGVPSTMIVDPLNNAGITNVTSTVLEQANDMLFPP